MYCQVIAALEALLHPDDLAEHLFLAFSLQVPQLVEVLSTHPDGFNLAASDGPGLNMRGAAVVTQVKAKDVTFSEFAEGLRDTVAKDVILRLDKAIQNNAHIEVRKDYAVRLMLSHLHFRQELN